MSNSHEHAIITCKYGHVLLQCRCFQRNKSEIVDSSLPCAKCARNSAMFDKSSDETMDALENRMREKRDKEGE